MPNFLKDILTVFVLELQFTFMRILVTLGTVENMFFDLWRWSAEKIQKV